MEQSPGKNSNNDNNKSTFPVLSPAVDYHRCGQCNTEFTDLDKFFQHKIEVEKCKMIPSTSKFTGLTIPRFICSLNSHPRNSGEKTPTKSTPSDDTDIEVICVRTQSHHQFGWSPHKRRTPQKQSWHSVTAASPLLYSQIVSCNQNSWAYPPTLQNPSYTNPMIRNAPLTSLANTVLSSAPQVQYQVDSPAAVYPYSYGSNGVLQTGDKDGSTNDFVIHINKAPETAPPVSETDSATNFLIHLDKPMEVSTNENCRETGNPSDSNTENNTDIYSTNPPGTNMDILPNSGTAVIPTSSGEHESGSVKTSKAAPVVKKKRGRPKKIRTGEEGDQNSKDSKAESGPSQRKKKKHEWSEEEEEKESSESDDSETNKDMIIVGSEGYKTDEEKFEYLEERDVWKCRLCGDDFRRKASARQHFRKHQQFPDVTRWLEEDNDIPTTNVEITVKSTKDLEEGQDVSGGPGTVAVIQQSSDGVSVSTVQVDNIQAVTLPSKEDKPASIENDEPSGEENGVVDSSMKPQTEGGGDDSEKGDDKNSSEAARKQASCYQCGKVLKNTRTLKAHMLRIHKEDRIYKCQPGCTFTFKDKASLERHKLRHSGILATDAGADSD